MHTNIKMEKRSKKFLVLVLVSFLSALFLWAENDQESALMLRQLEVETNNNNTYSNEGRMPETEMAGTICGRNADIIGTSEDFVLKDLFRVAATNEEYMYSTSCPKFDWTKPTVLIKQATKNPWGRTGNQIREFVNALQYRKDKHVQLAIMPNSFLMKMLMPMFMVRGPLREGEEQTFPIQNWVSYMESSFCVKIIREATYRSYAARWKAITAKELFYYSKSSKAPREEVIAHEVNTYRTLFQHYNDGNGRDLLHKKVGDMCSGINSLFGEEERSSTIYTAIHHRYLEGEIHMLERQANRTGCDPEAALDMTPDYIKSILKPLGMLQHPIVVMTDGQNKAGIQRLRDDPDIGPVLRLVPKDACWIGGDITLGVVANVFIGNPASTLSEFIAKSRASLGYGHSYLYRAKDESGSWYTVCEDDCMFADKGYRYSEPESMSNYTSFGTSERRKTKAMLSPVKSPSRTKFSDVVFIDT